MMGLPGTSKYITFLLLCHLGGKFPPVLAPHLLGREGSIAGCSLQVLVVSEVVLLFVPVATDLT